MKHLILRVLLMGILTSIFGQSLAAGPPAGTLTRDEGFVDIDLAVSEHRFSPNGTLTVVARARIEGTDCGFAIDLDPIWQTQQLENTPITLYRGKGHIRSIGPESDAFLALLQREYGQERSNSRMAARVAVTLIGMNDDPSELQSKPAKIKAFFDSGSEDSYGEVFINIDLQGKTVEFHDKDPDYHQGIMLSLTGGT